MKDGWYDCKRGGSMVEKKGVVVEIWVNTRSTGSLKPKLMVEIGKTDGTMAEKCVIGDCMVEKQVHHI